MKNKKRALRRFQERRIANKRRADIRYWFYEKFFKPDEELFFKRLKHNHYGCGCSGCKPWKHGLDYKYTVSERRKLQEEE
jgi:hypothetical protein